jgi:hypothetical protein
MDNELAAAYRDYLVTVLRRLKLEGLRPLIYWDAGQFCSVIEVLGHAKYGDVSSFANLLGEVPLSQAEIMAGVIFTSDELELLYQSVTQPVEEEIY